MSTQTTIKEWLNQNPDKNENDLRLFLTEEEVRSLPQFKNATDEEVQNIIDTLHDLALVTYELFCKTNPAPECRKDLKTIESKTGSDDLGDLSKWLIH